MYKHEFSGQLRKVMLGTIFKKKTDEQRLVEQLQEGDRAANATLYNRYARYLSAICCRYISNDDDVKDVMQDAFLRIFSSVSSFQYRGEGSLKGWMARIVLNESLNFINKNSRLAFTELKETSYDIRDEEVDTEQTPTEIIHQLIRQLPDGYRTVFNLYVIEEKSHKEIATLLGIKESTSASQLHKAKAMLATKIKEYQQHNFLSR